MPQIVGAWDIRRMTDVNQNRPTDAPNVFDYDDYRRFIKAVLDEGRARSTSVSLATVGRKAGLSKMAVKYLVDGKRHLAESSIDRMAKALSLGGSEQTFFRHLVLFNKAHGEDERAKQFEALLKLRNSPFKDLFLTHGEVGYFRRWYYPAIAELSYVKGFVADAAWIQARLTFKVPRAEIQAAVEYLDTHGYLKGGKRTDAKVKLPDGFKSQVYKTFAIEQTELGGQAIDEQSRADREVFNVTVSVDPERFAVAKAMVAEFRQKLHDALANDALCDRVVQINMQLFTLAKSEDAP